MIQFLSIATTISIAVKNTRRPVYYIFQGGMKAARKSEATRNHILSVGRDMVLTGGFGGVGLKALLERCCVPKGSFYCYFSSKEAFGCCLLQDYVDDYLQRMDALFALPESGGAKLMRFWSAWLEDDCSDGIADRCLVVKLAAEISDLCDLLGMEGLLVIFGTATGTPLQLSSGAMIMKHLTVKGFWGSKVSKELPPQERARLIGELVTLAMKGDLKLTAGGIYPLSDIAAVVKASLTSGRTGKILLHL